MYADGPTFGVTINRDVFSEVLDKATTTNQLVLNETKSKSLTFATSDISIDEGDQCTKFLEINIGAELT